MGHGRGGGQSIGWVLGEQPLDAKGGEVVVQLVRVLHTVLYFYSCANTVKIFVLAAFQSHITCE